MKRVLRMVLLQRLGFENSIEEETLDTDICSSQKDSAPKKKKRKNLNGWIRIWVFLTIIYLALVGIFITYFFDAFVRIRIISVFSALIVPPAILYLLGLGVAWVISGFKTTKET
jgi:hypothetical protein